MLDFSEDQLQVQKAIRSWCVQKLEPKVLAMEAGELDVYPVMKEMAQTFGIIDMVQSMFQKMQNASDDEPAKKKGLASDPALMAILTMELSRVCPGFALAFGASLGLFAGGIMARGTKEQKITYALPVLSFEKIGAWGLTEPGAGSDAFGSMKTRAQETEADGGGYRISGSKTFITNAPYADYFLIYAKLSETEVRSFIVLRTDKGVATSRPFKKMGMHASPTGEIFLDDVFVPKDRLLGGNTAENARVAAKSSLNSERFGMTPMLLGMTDRCLEEALKYSKQREQWGKPIATFQLVQEKIARIYTARSIMFTLLMRQLEADKQGVPLPGREASATKLYCARMTTECALEAVQIMGGAGYMTGSVVEMMARDAKLFQIGGGTDEIQMLRIARELLEAP
ncbi:MAG: acyl-CoA dehydrogenase family protein [Polyangiaceae bacterium]